jgi:hypothetical protein
MKRILAALLFFAITVGTYADDKAPAPSTQLQQTAPSESDLQSHKHYSNKDGQDIHSPSATKSGAVPAGASAKCRDGTFSFSTHHSGTCSHHGGVATWL